MFPFRLNTKASFTLALSALAGFLDVGLSCLWIARADVLTALAGGLAGAVGFTLLVLMVRLGAQKMGIDADDDHADAVVDRLAHIERLAEDAPDPEISEPRYERYFWNAVLAVMFGVFSVIVVVFGFVRTFLTVIVFASLVSDPQPLAVVATLVVSIGVQLLVDTFVFEPRARALGIQR